jgi:hypothetical protein
MPDSQTGRAQRAFEAAKPVLLAFALVAVAVAIRGGLLNSLGSSPQFPIALAGSFALHLATRPTRREIGVTLLVGLALRLAYGATYGVQPYFGSMPIAFGGFLGIASLLVLAYSAVRDKRFSAFGIAAFFPFVAILVGFILPVSNRLSPVTYDAHLFAADGTLGFQPSFVLGRTIAGRPLVWDIVSIVYYAIPVPVALLCAERMARKPVEVGRLLCLFGSLSVVGFSVYAICPATGPIYAFRAWFPSQVPHLSYTALGAALAVPGAPRNAMPSLHFGTALLVFWNTAHLRIPSRIAAGLFLAGTSFAVLALGEHYLIDVIVAVPFVLMFQAAFTRSGAGNARPRHVALWGGAAVTLAWLLTLRFGIYTLVAWPALAWTAIAVTLGFSMWARHALLANSGSAAAEGPGYS